MKEIIRWIFRGALATIAGSIAVSFMYFAYCVAIEIPTAHGYDVLGKTFLTIAFFLIGLFVLMVIGHDD